MDERESFDTPAPLHIANGDWLGLELSDGSGKNDGSVKGERYFQCAPGFGIFVRKESVVKIVKQAAPTQRSNGATPTINGSTAKPRASGIMPADVARKRQSMMSAGSGSAGSRLSSPTKSPTKAVSSASSAASTPRTGTPATTARTSDSSAKSRLSTSGRPSMAPPSAPVKTASPGSRASLGGPTSRATSKLSPSPARTSLSSSRMSLGLRVGAQAPRQIARPMQEEQPDYSNTIEEEATDDLQGIDFRLQETPEVDSKEFAVEVPKSEPEAEPPVSTQARPRTTSISRTTAATVESRTAERRENEQLKAKIRTLDKKLLENRDKIKSVDALQADKDRYETIIQTLQKKLKANQQEMNDLKSKYEEAEKRAGDRQGRSAEHESEIELATLDKEMAEERAEMYHAELEALKIKHEEVELEAEILREENRELGSVMSPEEKANAGWMQMEKEQERLRQALVLLRDMSQTNEAQLKGEVKELQDSLDEMEVTASKYTELVEQLERSEETNKHLKEQLEVAETNDEVVFAIEAQREQSLSTIEHLRKQIQDLEEHIQVTDELELFHVEEEKRLHYQLDESEALVNEKHHRTMEQAKSIEDLEYTLTKFRDVVQGLQSDIDEMRRSRDISETQAHEMSSKSRAMMDLNLQLQNTASKTQLKTIDYEMGKLNAEEANLHLDIMQLFVPDSFDADRNPVLALLCFRRIRSKAMLTKNLLTERMRDRPQLAQDDPFTVFEVMEKMSLITTSCHRSVQFMSTCSPEEFSRYSGALYELEPVERCMTGWIEALKLDELGHDGPEVLQRMIGILQDMAEKLISETGESKATELVAACNMVESYTESAAHQLATIVRAFQDRLGGPRDDDDESLVFDKKMDQFVTKARTIKYLSGKVTQLLSDLRTGSMCLGESSWVLFEDAYNTSWKLAATIRGVGQAVLAELGKVDLAEPLSYTSLINVMTLTAQKVVQKQDPEAKTSDEVFSLFASQLQALQSKIDDLQSKAADINSATEFESKPAPWTLNAKAVKAQKVISQDAQEELARLKHKAHEQVLQLAEKDKMIEEQQIKVDLLESRSKESKKNSADVNALGVLIEKIEKEKKAIVAKLEATQTDLEDLTRARDIEKAELETLKSAAAAGGGAAVVSKLGEQSEDMQLLQAQVALLETEVLSLQSAVRYLKTENQGLRVPVGELALHAERNAWLQPEHLGRATGFGEKRREGGLRKEGEDVLEGLIELAGAMKPIRLNHRGSKKRKAGSEVIRRQDGRLQSKEKKWNGGRRGEMRW